MDSEGLQGSSENLKQCASLKTLRLDFSQWRKCHCSFVILFNRCPSICDEELLGLGKIMEKSSSSLLMVGVHVGELKNPINSRQKRLTFC